jgi:hypothetical protein
VEAAVVAEEEEEVVGVEIRQLLRLVTYHR